MFQKILVVLVGLVMSLVGALTPDGLFASGPTSTLLGDAAPGPAVEQTLATLREADGAAFAKVPVLWVEVDGKRVLDDAWGTGELKELRFKVGVKDVEGMQVAIGDKRVELHPTDVLTVRTFRGDFAYRGMGTAAGTLQLQGTVQTTLLNAGTATGKLRTESTTLLESDPSRPARLAFVVLDTGEQLDTVRLDGGGARLFTEEAPEVAQARNAPGNLLARWVKIDGQLVREYTWGHGPVGRIEFEPAATTGGAVLAFKDAPVEAPPGAHAIVKEFVGEYLVYQVEGGFLRLRLDGYAEDFTTGAEGLGTAILSGPGAPLAGFEMTPNAPKSTDAVSFKDRSTDDGVVVFWRWDFGDGVISALQDPTHRFTRPGAYNVTLNVTDDDLRTTQVSRIVVVRNAEPLADFDFAPKVVTTDSIVAFTDLSLDPDGTIVNWTWDFGDGAQAFTRHPTHRFTKSGPLQVTLTLTDELGGRATKTLSVLVRNHPPVAAFEWSPLNPITNAPATFKSLAHDRDGRIVDWAWDFDGRPGAEAHGEIVAHTFRSPGEHIVTLTVTDDGGLTDTATALIPVENRKPVAQFEWTPNGGPVTTPVQFRNLATDPDGFVILSEWNWGDGSTTRLVTGNVERDATTAPQNVQYDVSRPSPPDAEHAFSAPGTYDVELCVTDNFTARDCVTHTVTIANSAPVAILDITPNPVYRTMPALVDSTLSFDPDGEPIVSRLIEFGDGDTTTQASATHVYRDLCVCVVKLTVRDPDGREGTTTKTIEVKNRPPEGRISLSRDPVAGVPVWFNATDVHDWDESPGELNFTWTFLPTRTPWYGPSIERTFLGEADMQAVLVIRDGEGASSNNIVRNFRVSISPPVAAFGYAPDVPTVGELVQFTDASYTYNDGGITSRDWQFDAEGTSTETNPTHRFQTGGLRTVTLTVEDNGNAGNGVASRVIRVNRPPNAQFAVGPHGALKPGDIVTFLDTSSDPDGATDIRARRWDFGDATLETGDTTVQHAFSRPGTFTVKLTIEDQRGVTSTSTTLLTIADRAPIAAWHVETLPPFKRGDAIQFASDSTDPDGTPIVSYRWVWGDGTETVGTDPRPVHAYARSGTYTVHLEVSDGELKSSPLQGTATLRIWGRDDVTLDVSARLPHGALADLSQPKMAVEIRHHSPNGIATYAGAQLSAPTPEHRQLVLPGGTWADGDLVEAKLHDGRWMPATIRAVKQVHLRDEDGTQGVLALVLEDNIPVIPTVRAEAEDGGVLDNAPENARGEAVYGSPLEAFHGTGTVAFLDGVVAKEAEVTVQLRYLPLVLPNGDSARDDVDDDSPVSTSANDVLGWCTAAVVLSDDEGAFEWSARDDDAECAIPDLATAPGRWQVRAIARSGTATPGTSDVEEFYMDPTGVVADQYVP